MKLIKLASGHIVDIEKALYLQPPVKVHMQGLEPQNAQLVMGIVSLSLADIDYQIVKRELTNMLENQALGS